MKLYVIPILFIFILLNAPKKRVLPYEVVSGAADLIVEGKVIEEESRLFTGYWFQITSSMKTNTNKGKILVKAFQEWTCDHRSKPIEEDQKLLLFLKESGNGYYNIINGSTGELFYNEKVIIPNDSFDYFEFKESIKLLLETFKYSGPVYPSYLDNPSFKKLKNQTEIEELKKKNAPFKYFAESIENNYRME